MNINTSPDVISRSSVNITPGYMSGFGNSFETEALPGALPMGRQLAATLRLRSLCRAAFGFAVYRTARQQRALVAVSHPAVGAALWPLRQGRCGLWRTAPCHEQRAADRAIALDPAPIPKEDMTFPAGRADHDHGGRCQHPAGMAAHVYLITQSMVDQHF